MSVNLYNPPLFLSLFALLSFLTIPFFLFPFLSYLEISIDIKQQNITLHENMLTYSLLLPGRYNK